MAQTVVTDTSQMVTQIVRFSTKTLAMVVAVVVPPDGDV